MQKRGDQTRYDANAIKVKAWPARHQETAGPVCERLVCVRYRYDEQKKKRSKTVELIVGEVNWEPKARHKAGDTMVGLRIDWREMELRRKVKQVGGKWNPKRRVWEMRYDRVVELGLEEWLVEEGSI